jgi:hypothetical protein
MLETRLTYRRAPRPAVGDGPGTDQRRRGWVRMKPLADCFDADGDARHRGVDQLFPNDDRFKLEAVLGLQLR